MELQYHYHFTQDEVTSILRAAHTAVEDSDVPEDLVYAAFEKACDLLSNKVGLGQQSAIAPATIVPPPRRNGPGY